MAKRTPKQQRRATARMVASKLPEKVKPSDTVLTPREIKRIIRDLER